jgi:hypothetical protein
MQLRSWMIAMAGATSLALASPAMAGSGDWVKDFKVSGRAELRVEVDDGRVTLTGTDSKQIEARVLITGWKMGPDGVQVYDRQVGDRVELDVRIAKMNRWFNVGERSVRVEIRVPNDLIANVHTRDGAIVVDGVRGSLKLRTGDGRVEATRVDGALAAETGDGSIRIRGRLDALSLRTGDGSIEADVMSGSKITSGWDVGTGDGHVTLRLPAGFNAELDAHTNDGKIDTDFPVTTSRFRSGNDLRGRLNSGGATLKVRTGDGAIRIQRN